MIDEGPSPEDIARFDRDTSFCPNCGAEVWDEAPRCSSCGDLIDGGQTRHPVEERAQRRVTSATAIIILIGFVGFTLLWGLIWLVRGTPSLP